MKIIFLVLAIGLFASLSKADTLKDIGSIAASQEVAAFLSENNLRVKSISYYLTAYCAGGPSNFVIHTQQPEKCVWVKVGNCESLIDRSQIKILSTPTNLKCE